MKKKVTIIGGAGTIGSILYRGLGSKYHIVILDKKAPEKAEEFIEVDATDYDSLCSSIPKDSDALINLLTMKSHNDLQDIQEFQNMTKLHFMASFYVLHAAITLDIPKIVYASSNHTTDYYEKDGYSTLGREVTTADYPYSNGLYGVLKLASENIGHILSHQTDNNLSLINLRIGSVHPDEMKAVTEEERLHRTLLTHEDTVQLFDLALESKVRYGTYFGVSDNPQKPWSTSNVFEQLGFISRSNALDVLKKDKNL